MSSCSNRGLRFGGYHPYSYPLTREHKNISYIRNIIYAWENENTRTDSSTKCYHKTQALMGRRVSRRKCNAYTLNKGSQTALITLKSVSLCFNARTRDASPISGSVLCLRLVLAFSACVLW